MTARNAVLVQQLSSTVRMIPPLLKHPLLAFALRQVALDASANGHPLEQEYRL